MKTKIGPFLAACLAVGNGQAQSTFTQVTTGPIATDSASSLKDQRLAAGAPADAA